MSAHRPLQRRLLVVLCLLLLQVQVMAAATLGCLHAGGADAGIGAAAAAVAAAGTEAGIDPRAGDIRHHCLHAFDPVAADGVADQDPADAPWSDCWKCALDLCAGQWHPLAGAGISALRPLPAILAATPPRHFYRFIPERLSEPPIRLHA